MHGVWWIVCGGLCVVDQNAGRGESKSESGPLTLGLCPLRSRSGNFSIRASWRGAVLTWGPGQEGAVPGFRKERSTRHSTWEDDDCLTVLRSWDCKYNTVCLLYLLFYPFTITSSAVSSRTHSPAQLSKISSDINWLYLVFLVVTFFFPPPPTGAIFPTQNPMSHVKRTKGPYLHF